MTEEQIAFEDKNLLEIINTMYHGEDFYYIDISLDAGVIERIITSFHFKGATRYDKDGL